MLVKRKTERLNLTKKAIDALSSPDERRAIFYDTQTRGLGVMVQPTGHKAFFWFRKVRGYPTWQTIGPFPDLTVEQARTKASELNAKTARWKDNGYDGDNPFTEQRDITLGELVTDYVERQVKNHAAHPDRAVRDVEGMVKTYLTPWKSRRLRAIRRADILNLHAQLGADSGKVTANRVVQFLRTVFSWASKAEVWSGDNPARNINFFHEDRRTRFLQPAELALLFKALKKDHNADLRDFVLLALFTGARKSDVFSMRWENLYLDDNRWEVPKPKNRKPYLVPLMPESVDLLNERRARSKVESPWVFPSHGSTGHLVNLKKPWQRLLKTAGISDFRIHDLRRTLGSWQAGQGTSLKIIGESLGHSSIAATQIYARLNLDPVRQSVETATRAMIVASKKKPKRLKAGTRG
jgi:integrase